MGKSSSGRRLSTSTVVASLMVAGAGCITWFGLTSGGAPAVPVTAASAATTLPADEALAVNAGPAALPGQLPTRIVAPSAGIDAPISEVGVVLQDGRPTWETAWRSVGHHMDSARPGQPGNMVLSGHVSVANSANIAAFKTLDRLSPGDVVEVHSGDQVFRYTITKVAVVPPSEVRLLRSDHTARLTLITCTKDLKQRLVVVGTLL